MRKTATRASNICVFEIKDSRFGRFAQELFSFVHFAAAVIQSMMWIDRFFSISFPSEPFRRSLRRWANARNVSFVLFGYVQKWTQSQKLQIFVVFAMIVIFGAFATIVKPLSLLSFDSMICYLQLSKLLNREGARKGTSNVKKIPKIKMIAKKKKKTNICSVCDCVDFWTQFDCYQLVWHQSSVFRIPTDTAPQFL